MVITIPIKSGVVLSRRRERWFKPQSLHVFPSTQVMSRSLDLSCIAIHVITPRSIPVCLSLDKAEAAALAHAILDTLREDNQ